MNERWSGGCQSCVASTRAKGSASSALTCGTMAAPPGTGSSAGHSSVNPRCASTTRRDVVVGVSVGMGEVYSGGRQVPRAERHCVESQRAATARERLSYPAPSQSRLVQRALLLDVAAVDDRVLAAGVARLDHERGAVLAAVAVEPVAVGAGRLRLCGVARIAIGQDDDVLSGPRPVHRLNARRIQRRLAAG